MNKKHALIFALLITGLLATNILLLSNTGNNLESAVVSRVIDGDTLEIADGRTLRLININTPERGQSGYEEAKIFLSKLENKTIQIETLGLDKYQRTLARVYDLEYINLEIIKNGLANPLLVRDEEVKLFKQAELDAIHEGLGIFKKSPYEECLKTEINPKKEIVKIINYCQPINLNSWTLKDESRKIYKFNNIYLGSITLHSNDGNDNTTDLFWNQEDIWNNDRDSLYIYDNENKLVYHTYYGY